MVPSNEIQSPSLTTTSLSPTFTVNCFLCSSMCSAPAPTMQGSPMPRATTAAWLDLPPTAVRMPLATSMPWMSSGVVSLRTRITGPFLDASTASSAVKTARPTAAPGDASIPFASLVSVFERRRIEHRMQQLIELLAAPRAAPLPFVDHAFLHHVDRDAHRGRAGALAVARLQHVQLAVLDGELEILHVAIVLFEVAW